MYYPAVEPTPPTPWNGVDFLDCSGWSIIRPSKKIEHVFFSFFKSRKQGCQIFLDTMYQNEGNYIKLPQHYQNDRKICPMTRKIFQMSIEYTSISHSNAPSKIYPNWDFWFENKPSGNPGRKTRFWRLTSFSTWGKKNFFFSNQATKNLRYSQWLCYPAK
jgi:hypothetical protein